MIALKTVLVATDFGEASDAALAYGRALARMFGGRLHLLYVTENQFLTPMIDNPEHAHQAIRTRLNELLGDEARRGVHGDAALETSDTPAEAIVEYARRIGADLIVTGTHGRTGLDRWLTGSVAEHVVRRAPCPVLTVRHRSRALVVADVVPENRVSATRSKQEGIMIDLKDILVATDFSEASDAALNYGRALARHFDACLHVLHVVQNVEAQAFGDSYIAALPELQADLEEGARKQLAPLLIDNDEKPLRTTSAIRRSGMPAVAIVDYAKAHGIDIIVMGTHGRGALAHLLMGSVAERVVRTAPCPVLTVRHPEHEFVLPDALTMRVAHA